MVKYIIPKGDHYSNLIASVPSIPEIPGLHAGIKVMEGKIKFDASCKYGPMAKPCTNDVNKAVGFGYGLWPNAHQKWSMRLGWRTNIGGKLILVLYAYVNGQRVNINIGARDTFTFNEEYSYKIENDTFNKLGIIQVEDVLTAVDFNKTPEPGWILKPYFGGDCTAPQDMLIELSYN